VSVDSKESAEAAISEVNKSIIFLLMDIYLLTWFLKKHLVQLNGKTFLDSLLSVSVARPRKSFPRNNTYSSNTNYDRNNYGSNNYNSNNPFNYNNNNNNNNNNSNPNMSASNNNINSNVSYSSATSNSHISPVPTSNLQNGKLQK